MSLVKIVQVEDKENLFALLRCSLSYAKIVQVEDKENLFALLRCNLSLAKIRFSLQKSCKLVDY